MPHLGKEDNILESLIETISEQGFEGMGKAVQILLNEAMKVERSAFINAAPYQRNQARKGYANGYKPKTLNTRVGSLALEIPQVRDCNFYPSSLERGMRSEKALRLAVAEMYIQGVSTRRVQNITRELCGHNVSSADVSRAAKMLDNEQEEWRNRPLGCYRYMVVDAIYEKVRHNGASVISAAVLTAYGIREDNGKREILGVSVSLSEHEVHWRNFFMSLVERGLHGIKMITSDAHSGLKAAMQTVFPTVPWQRCQFHLQQNAAAHVTKKDTKEQAAKDIRAILNAPDREEASILLRKIVQKYSGPEPKLAAWMEENIPEALTVLDLPDKHQKKLRTSNLAERINKEIRRRTKVVGIFPNEQSAKRLITAILMEINEEWSDAYVYLDMNN